MDPQTQPQSNTPSNIYPALKVTHIQNPNRFYAVFLIGILAKVIMIIPVGLWLLILYFANFFVAIINSFVVLFTGKYWDPCYELNIGIFRISARTTLYFYGLTDKYPGFSFRNTDPSVTLDMPKPEAPNRFFAIPIFGGVARIVLLIPYFIYAGVLSNASFIGMFISSFPVLFTGRYPEATYELERDYVRVQYASSAYMVGLSDKYPSFWISMNHQTAKILLIIFGALMGIGNIFNGGSNSSSGYNPY